MFLKSISERALTDLKLVGKTLKVNEEKEIIKLENHPKMPG
jgi:hypothetical protein